MGKMSPRPVYKRIVLKVSGEALQSSKTRYGIESDVTHKIAAQIKEIKELGIQVGVVIGGGNIFRGTGKLSARTIH